MTFEVPTMLWGSVAVKYHRDATGRETLRVPACTMTAEEWSENPVGPPPILCDGDITTTSLWASYVRSAKNDAVATAKELEDSKFNYKKPAQLETSLGNAIVSAEVGDRITVKDKKPKKAKPSSAKNRPIDPELAAEKIPPPLNVGSAGFATPAELGMKQTRPNSVKR